MRPVKITMNAAGYSQWVPIDYIESWFGVGVAVVLSEDGNLTYSVQHTFDFAILEAASQRVSIARVAAVATVTDAGPFGIGHGLTTGDSVVIKGSASANLDSPPPLFGHGDVGLSVASTPSTTTYTYAVANSGATADGGNAKVLRQRVFTSTLAAQTTRGTVTYNYPVRAVRLYVSAYTAGFVDMLVLQGSAA